MKILEDRVKKLKKAKERQEFREHFVHALGENCTREEAMEYAEVVMFGGPGSGPRKGGGHEHGTPKKDLSTRAGRAQWAVEKHFTRNKVSGRKGGGRGPFGGRASLSALNKAEAHRNRMESGGGFRGGR